jgi:general stress protein CsbA
MPGFIHVLLLICVLIGASTTKGHFSDGRIFVGLVAFAATVGTLLIWSNMAAQWS